MSFSFQLNIKFPPEERFHRTITSAKVRSPATLVTRFLYHLCVVLQVNNSLEVVSLIE